MGRGGECAAMELILFCVFCSEDWCDDMSSGEESLSSSLGSDAEGPYFPMHYRCQSRKNPTF